jgi:hypothetical protein
MMMFRTMLAGALALAIVAGVQAQPTQAPPSSPQPEPPASAAPPGAPPGAMQPPPGGAMQSPQAPPGAAQSSAGPTNMPTPAAIRNARQACRDAASAQRLQGRDFDRSVQSCFAQKFPAVAAHQRDCRRQGLGQGLKDADLRAFVISCMKG